MTSVPLEEVKLEIADIAHVFWAEPNTTVSLDDIAQINFGDTSTYPTGWDWYGDLSAESILEYSQDGGDRSFKRTHSRKKLRAKAEEKTYTLTLTALNRSRKQYEALYPNGVYNSEAKGFDLLDGSKTREAALLVLIDDEDTYFPIWHPRVEVDGKLPVFSLEEFTELPADISLLPDANRVFARFYDPVKKNPAAA